MSQQDWSCVIVPRDQNHYRPVVYGMGVLVNDRTVVTCAHVINQALGSGWDRQKNEGIVSVCFPFTEGPVIREGMVDKHKWYPPGNPEKGKLTDIAVVHFKEDAPKSVSRAVLKAPQIDAEIKAYGFRGMEVQGRWRSHRDGEIAPAKLMGSLASGRLQLDGLRNTGAGVEKGFSGAGVYDPIQDAVVGIVVEADRDKTRKIAQAISATDLTTALGESQVLVPGLPSATKSFIVDPELKSRTESKLQEIERYLEEVSEALTPPDPDTSLVDYLKPVLTDVPDVAGSILLRQAFGFPKSTPVSCCLSEIISSTEASLQPFSGLIAQRVDHLLWRYRATLQEIDSAWVKPALDTVDSLRAIAEPLLLARQPNLLDISAALQFKKELELFTESAPDPTLYAVLRALGSSKYRPLAVSLPEQQRVRDRALDFVYEHLRDVLAGFREVDDSSNVWWSIRTGIDNDDDRFLGLLPQITDRFRDIRVPSASVSRLAALPEIHKSLRTTSYTLSNAQHIVEVVEDLDPEMRKRLHAVITVMLDRLLRTPRSNQLYLASVHHEGLRNYLDYIQDQEM